MVILILVGTSVVFADTTLCVVDESGMYISGARQGEYDTSLASTAYTPPELSTPAISTFNLQSVLAALSAIFSTSNLHLIIAIPFMIFIILGFFIIGGSKVNNVR